MRLASCLFLLAGCVPDAGQLSQPIIGGTDDPDDPAVVMVSGSGGGGYICTGTVVSPHVVLTAAHCVAPSEVGIGTYQIFLGTNFNDHRQRGAAYLVNVLEVHWDPRFKPKNLGGSHDVGVLVTTDPIPRPTLPINRYPITQADVGQPVRFIGYGMNEDVDPPGTFSAGVKRTTTSTLADFDADLLSFTDGAHAICHGDSGGPGLMTIYGNTVIASITSYVYGSCTGGVNYDTRADVYGPFADPYIAKFDPDFQQADLWAGIHDFSVPERDASVTMSAPPPMQGCRAAPGERSAPATAIAGLGLLALALMTARRRRSARRDAI